MCTLTPKLPNKKVLTYTLTQGGISAEIMIFDQECPELTPDGNQSSAIQ